MVERLKEFVVSLENEKSDIENADFEEIIKTKVSDYEQQVRAEFSEMRSKRIAEKDVEISAFKRFIEAEEKRAEEEAYKQFLAEKELANSVSIAETEVEITDEFPIDVSAENL